MTDSDSKLPDPIAYLHTDVLGKESEHRFTTLFNESHAGRPQLTPLGQDVFALEGYKRWCLSAVRFRTTPEQYLRELYTTLPPDTADTEEARASAREKIYRDARAHVYSDVNRLYYAAKNWA